MTETKGNGFVIKDYDPYAEQPHHAHNADGLGLTQPDVHCFVGQKPEDVKKVCEVEDEACSREGDEKPRWQAPTLEQIEQAKVEEAVEEAMAQLEDWKDNPEKAEEMRATLREEIKATREQARKDKEAKARE